MCLLGFTFCFLPFQTVHEHMPFADCMSEEAEGPFTLQKIVGTARIKMVHVPKNIARIPRLHILFSAVLTTVK